MLLDGTASRHELRVASGEIPGERTRIGDARLIPASFDFEIRCSSLMTSAPCCKHAQTESKCSNFYPGRYMD